MDLARTQAGTTEKQRLRMSYEEYLQWADEDTVAEWVDGEVIIHMPARHKHQHIILFLAGFLVAFVELFDRGLVQISPFEVKLWPDGPSREPDIFFLAKERRDALTNERLNGAPDLIIEVISPDSVRRDRAHKFREYEAAGVREYWIVDSRQGHQRADFYRLDENGRYELFATEDDEVVHSAVLADFWLHPAWLWQEPMPNPLLMLSEIVGADRLIERLHGGSQEAGKH